MGFHGKIHRQLAVFGPDYVGGGFDMSRPKKDGHYINANIDRQVYEDFCVCCEALGQKKTTAVERAIRQYVEQHVKEISAYRKA